MNEQSAPVLIVGAGPTGLMLACQLARHGVDFRIIDPKDGPTLQSRAMVVQARSMEVYDQLGLGKVCLDRAHQMRGLSIFVDGSRRATVDLGDAGKGLTRHAGAVVLEQSENERILVDALEQLGHTVEWGVEFQSMEMDDEKCTVTMKHTEGDDVETVAVSWVVGCDGARSPVRHALNFSFEGGTYNATFYVADVDIEGDVLPRDFASMFIADAGFALAFPMTGGDGRRYRLIGAVPSEASELPGWMKNPEFSVVADAFRKLSGMPLEFNNPEWFATYAVHHRKVESFRRGRALLAGDAAHVHSPAGGQGMNTGLQDAHNLGWKLALVVKGVADEALIDTYNEEREAFARYLLSSTDSAFHIMASDNQAVAWFRKNVVPAVMGFALQFPGVRTEAFRRVSQIGLEYRTSSLSRTSRKVRDGDLRAGDRFPYCKVLTATSEVESPDLFLDPGFVVLDFSSERGPDMLDTVNVVAEELGIEVKYHMCKMVGEVKDRKGAGKVVYVVRPDMYIGMADATVKKDSLVQYLRDCIHVKVGKEML